MRDDLMPEKVEIDPAIGAAPFATAKHVAIESAGGVEVVDRKRKVKGAKRHDRR